MRDGWEERAFGDLYLEPSRNGIMAPQRIRGSGVALVNMKEIFAFDAIRDQRMELAPLPARDPAKWLLHGGDLLFARQSLVAAGAGRCVYVHPSVAERTFESHIIRVRLDPSRSDPRFYFYLFRSATGRQRIESIVEQVAVAGIRGSDLARLDVPVPSLTEQRAIAGVLGALDDLIDANERLMKALDCQVLSACERAASAARDVTTFGAMAARTRNAVTPHTVSDSTTYLGLEHFGENATGLLGRGRAGDTVSGKSRFEPGDILYGKLRPYFRKVARPDFAGVCSTEIWVVRPINEMVPTYLYGVMASQPFSDFAMSGSEGTKMPRASWDHLAHFTVARPDSHSLAKLERDLDPLWRMYWQLSDEADEARRTRHELLPLLMSGEVAVREVVADVAV